jgi:hypothetical protein
MADTLRRASYYHITIPNRPGEGARVLRALKDAGADLMAVHAFPRGGAAQVDFVPRDEAAFQAAARQAGVELSDRKTVFLVQGEDRPGAGANLLEKLGTADINVTALDAVSVDGRYGALLWVADEDIEEAARALGAS